MIKKLCFYLITLVLISCNNDYSGKQEDTKRLDSAVFYLNKSKRVRLPDKLRVKALQKAFRVYSSKNIDSLNLLSSIVLQSISLGNKELFTKANWLLYEQAEKEKDTFHLAEVNWNFGDYYYSIEKLDSAYYYYKKAQKLYKTRGDNYYEAKMFSNMANIKSYYGDYTGSEVLYFKALEVFKKLNRTKSLFGTYNNLAIVYKNLGEYDKAIEYNTKAEEYLRGIKDEFFYKEGILNNYGLIFQKKKEYVKALVYFHQAIAPDSLKYKSPVNYARFLDNKAYTSFLLKDTVDVLKDFNEALRIREKEKNDLGKITSYIHLTEFYLSQKDTFSARSNVQKAYLLSKEINNGEKLLQSLLFLSRIEPDKKEKHLLDYIYINDSVQEEQRTIRNKFARIDFETETFKERTKKLKKINKWAMIALIAFSMFFFFFYYSVLQRSKNRKLVFEKEQEESNKKIYSLLVEKQAKLKEGQIKERQRISEELHDGVLGSLFGLRMGFDFLQVKGDKEEQSQYAFLLDEMKKVEGEIRNISHKLKSNVLQSGQDFSEIIKELIDKNKQFLPIDLTINNIPWDLVKDECKINIYRILQEALSNIFKHANAKKVYISFSFLEDEMIEMKIEDDGVGFKRKKNRKGIGLKNIYSRVKKMKGKINFESNLGKGTKITILVPLKYNMPHYEEEKKEI